MSQNNKNYSYLIILNELKNILENETTKDGDYTNLYDVLSLIKKNGMEYYQLESEYQNKLDMTMMKLYGKDAFCCLHKFDSENNIIHIDFSKKNHLYDTNVLLKKDNGALYVIKTNNKFYAKNYYKDLGNIISNYYEEVKKFNDFRNQYVFGVNILGTRLKVNIYSSVISFDYSSITKGDFVSATIYGYDKDNKSNCENKEFLCFLNENLDTLLKKLYIPIRGCPFWMRDELTTIRNNELIEEEKLQKRLKLKRKIFPWLKK